MTIESENFTTHPVIWIIDERENSLIMPKTLPPDTITFINLQDATNLVESLTPSTFPSLIFIGGEDTQLALNIANAVRAKQLELLQPSIIVGLFENEQDWEDSIIQTKGIFDLQDKVSYWLDAVEVGKIVEQITICWLTNKPPDILDWNGEDVLKMLQETCSNLIISIHKQENKTKLYLSIETTNGHKYFVKVYLPLFTKATNLIGMAIQILDRSWKKYTSTTRTPTPFVYRNVYVFQFLDEYKWAKKAHNAREVIYSDLPTIPEQEGILIDPVADTINDLYELTSQLIL